MDTQETKPPQYLHPYPTQALERLRANASLASVAAATRRVARSYWHNVRVLQAIWKQGNPGDWSDTRKAIDRETSKAMTFGALADHLERLAGIPKGGAS